MSWDLALLRKFSCTSHFRLLNQVRSELKAQPLIRDSIKKTLTVQAKPYSVNNDRPSRRPNALNQNNIDASINSELLDNSNSFRDRLNSIDMR